MSYGRKWARIWLGSYEKLKIKKIVKKNNENYWIWWLLVLCAVIVTFFNIIVTIIIIIIIIHIFLLPTYFSLGDKATSQPFSNISKQNLMNIIFHVWLFLCGTSKIMRNHKFARSHFFYFKSDVKWNRRKKPYEKKVLVSIGASTFSRISKTLSRKKY